MMPADQHVRDRLAKLQLPPAISAHDLQIATRDAEILTETLRTKPDQMHALVTAVMENNHEQAQRLVHELGITEQDVKAKGGGFYILIVVVVLLWATDAY